MKNDLGIIKNIQPILNTDKLASGKLLTSLVFLRVNASRSIYVANKLSEIPEVKCIFLTTGEHNIIVKLMISEGGRGFLRSSST
jgi:DNA-binding Lrp family transcriptional regulator